jgi:hypothetical protein
MACMRIMRGRSEPRGFMCSQRRLRTAAGEAGGAGDAGKDVEVTPEVAGGASATAMNDLLDHWSL